MRISEKKVHAFQLRVLQYYRDFGRDLPWRKTTDPYTIWISEIMLQQTQVDRVVDYFTRWLKKWPTVQSLSRADRSTVLTQWMGLGYNNRAVNLHNAAKKIVSEFKGDVIVGMLNFKEIKGIGPYTSSAVQIFSKNKDIVTVDTNIRRILIHEFTLDEKISDKELWEIAENCLPRGRSRDWHNGLMDYGATFLTSRRTGIKPKTQQSKFHGSDRQIRAKVLRHLLVSSKSVLFSELLEIAGKKCDDTRLQRILDKMIKDDLIKAKNEKYVLVT